MSNWVDRWTVQSESDSNRFYTVSRAADGSFGCSCPAWIFRKMTCKHIQGVASTIVGLTETENSKVNRLRFISKMHHIKLSCENCKRIAYCGKPHYGNDRDKEDLVFVKGEKKTFYILGRCCTSYEKDPNA